VATVSDNDPASVQFPQLLQAPLLDGRLLLVFSGVALVTIRGESADWHNEILTLILNTGAVGSSRNTFIHDQAAPLVTLNSIFTPQASVNSGFAVNWCRVLPHTALYRDFIVVLCSVAVRDDHARLYRVGYQVTVTGKLHDVKDEGERPSWADVDLDLKKLQAHPD
jgi:hypothetical protein